MSVWQTAWLFSSLMAGIVFIFSYRSGLTIKESTLLSIAWFPSPVAYTFSGSNSVIYLFDFIVPVAVYFAFKRCKFTSTDLKLASCFLLFSAGIVPAFLTFSYAELRVDILINLINCYRLAGALALMNYFAGSVKRPINQSFLLIGFSLACLVVLVSMLLQGQGLTNSDVLFSISGDFNSREYKWNIDSKSISLGLFRASLGMLGMTGVALSIVKDSTRFVFHCIRIIGGFAGVLVMILAGSKSSILASGIIFVWFVLFEKSNLLTKLAVILFFFLLAATLFYTVTFYEEFIPPLLRNLMQGRNEGLYTLEERSSRLSDCWRILGNHPEMMLGWVKSDTFSDLLEEPNTAYFHDEYLSVLMLGGLLNLTAYLFGVGLLLRQIIFRINKFSTLQQLARFVLIGCLIQGFSVAHLQPNVLFVCPVAIFCCVYGLGIVKETDVEIKK